jgi:DNA adenine methylase
MGGKSKLRKEIIARLPEHRCYVEVFGGAAWVLFGKEPSKVEVYNDLDGELTNFFRVIKSCHRAFVQSFDWVLVSRKLFYEFLATNLDELDEIQRAVRFYYVIKTSFGGKWDKPSFGYSKAQPSSLNVERLYETISAVHNRLRRVYIEEGTFHEVVRRYDGEETCFFLDPPYFGTAGYAHKMAVDDYTELEETLRGIQGRFLLTINDHEAMRMMFRNYRIEEVSVPYCIGRDAQSRGKYGELIVTNY